MKRALWVALALASLGYSQTYTRQNIAAIFGFENNVRAGVFPAGWSGNTTSGIVTDREVVHSGKYSARFDRTGSSTPSYSTISQSIPVDFGGKVIVWRGWIKMQNVDDYVALWMSATNAKGDSVQFATMQGQRVRGTADWQQYFISIPWNADTRNLSFGLFLSGAGTAWVDDLELLVDGKPVALAPNPEVTVLETDHEFDNGSRIAPGVLTTVQIGNLATLAKVWGFLKYHHPAVTSGGRHWDYDLFRVMPGVLAAPDQATALGVISEWISGLGPVTPCANCATLETGDLALSRI